jgi:hypothetical protein
MRGACKMRREGVQLAAYRGDNRRTCQIRNQRIPKEFRKKSRDKTAIVPDCEGSVIRFAVFVGFRGDGNEPIKAE